ncbi:uncharacterized protein LOC143583381 [Bidens hawaiensis]|uniref:uncharacterized protein LOC143583381 n=1 Tax=Bidens hawaiensis TaxID=980011 RepID=UPI004049A071
MGLLLDDAKSETWFVDALNGAGLLPRGLSDSATIDNLLEHKDNVDVESETRHRPNSEVPLHLPEVDTTSSSFRSSSSSPSMSNRPPIKVKEVDQMAGLDEQLNVHVGGWATSAVADDERSDHGVLRKPPLPLQRKFANYDAHNLPSPDPKHGGAYCLHSPDSIASDNSSIASANCQSKTTFSQDTNTQSNIDTPIPPATTQVYPNKTINYHIPIQSIQETSLTQDQQQQFYQPRPHFIQHHTTSNQPVSSSYYQVYAQPPPQIDNQQYPLYFLPVTSQNHHYNYNGIMQLQSNTADANPTNITSSAATPPLYPTKPLNKPDMAPNPMYGTTTLPDMIQVPSNHQFQQQYLNVSQIPHHPPTPVLASKYANQTQEPVYYSHHQSVAAQLTSVPNHDFGVSHVVNTTDH